MQPQSAGQSFGIGHAPLGAPIQQIGGRGCENIEEFAVIKGLRTGRQPTGKPNVNVFSGVRNNRVGLSRVCPLGRRIAGFFFQFAHGARQATLTRVELARRKLDHHAPYWIPKLSFQDHPAIIHKWNDHDGTRVKDVFTGGQTTIG